MMSDSDERQHYAAQSSGTDNVKLNDTLNLNKFPFGINAGGQVASGSGLNGLGLGLNSTLLKELETAGAINSKTWSMFQGWSGAEASQQMDGSLVLGGYDRAKVTGSNVTIPMQYDVNCPQSLLMTLTDITMNLKNGSSTSILGTSHANALKACIDPKGNALSLPEDIWSSFLSVSGSTEVGRSTSSINFWSMLVSADGACVLPPRD